MGTFTISIHAPRVGRDGTPKHKHKFTFLFQSTRPVWGATLHPRRRRCAGGISIHAPRVGRDKGGLGAVLVLVISIHAPRVGRDVLKECLETTFAISIHAPRVGRDQSPWPLSSQS